MVKRAPARCGTQSGWHTHKHNGEKPCDACAAAKSEYDKRWRAAPEQQRKNRLAARAQAVANGVLKARYPDEHREAYEAAKRILYAENGLTLPDASGEDRRGHPHP